MRTWFNCPKYAELLFYDIEGLAPRDQVPIRDIVKEELGPVDLKLLLETINEVLAGQGCKENHIFTTCLKCGTRVEAIHFMQVS